MKAYWQNQLIAESDETIEVEGNQYFPAESVNMDYLKPSETHTTCPWKGRASYYHIKVGEAENPDAAWFYPEPKEAASQIRNYVAFWKGVDVRPS